MSATKQNRLLGFVEMILRRLQSSTWQAVYLSMAGFVLVPSLRWLRYDDGSLSRLIVSLLAMLVALRVVPAVFRKVVPFSADLQAQWFHRRRIAKRYDSYQWRKLLWIGVGIGVYVALFDRQVSAATAVALTCVICGAAGTLAWRRITAIDPVAANPSLN